MKQLPEEDSQSELLQQQTSEGANINATKQHRDYSSIIDKPNIARKKKIKYGIIAGIILVIIILAIVLPLSLKGKGGNNPDNPPIVQHYNPYSTKTFDNHGSNISAVIQAPATYDHDLHMQALNNIIPTLKDGTKKLGVDSKAIPKGANNKFSQELNVQMDLVTWRVAHLTISDASKTPYSIPESAVPKPKGDNSMRTDAPLRETSNIYDGSSVTADMATQNVIGDAMRGASWVSLHNGGGTGWGKATNGGFGMVLDGSDEAEQRARSMLFWDVSNGLTRRARAGNPNALRTILKLQDKYRMNSTEGYFPFVPQL